jgi:DNA-binding response OmpR family regulator
MEPTKRVLIVDDNKDFADAIALTLQQEGYVARACYDGSEALQQAATFQPQIVMLDIHMPKLTGYEAARVFGRHPEGMRPVLIALTGATGEAAQVRAQMAGFDYYVAKPAESTALVALVKSIA